MLQTLLTLIEEQADRIRFEDIYNGYYKQMLMVAGSVLDNQADAEDAVQDALLRIARNMTALRNREDWAIRGYVLTVVKNAALQIHNRDRRYGKKTDSRSNPMEETDGVFQRVINLLDYDLLLRAVQHLDYRYRQVLTLAYLQEMCPREIADLLGRKEDTVRKQLYRGRKLLIDFCKKEGINFGSEGTDSF